MKSRLSQFLFVASLGATAITATAENGSSRDSQTDRSEMDATTSSAQDGETRGTVPAVDGDVTGTANLVTAKAPPTYVHTRRPDTNLPGDRQLHANCDRQLDSCLPGDDPDQ